MNGLLKDFSFLLSGEAGSFSGIVARPGNCIGDRPGNVVDALRHLFIGPF